MKLNEVFGDILEEAAKKIWTRRGSTIERRKFRCTSGPKAGMLVSTPTACGQAKDPKKRRVMKQTQAKKGKRIQAKRRKTLKRNPVTKRVIRLNKS